MWKLWQLCPFCNVAIIGYQKGRVSRRAGQQRQVHELKFAKSNLLFRNIMTHAQGPQNWPTEKQGYSTCHYRHVHPERSPLNCKPCLHCEHRLVHLGRSKLEHVRLICGRHRDAQLVRQLGVLFEPSVTCHCLGTGCVHNGQQAMWLLAFCYQALVMSRRSPSRSSISAL